MEGNKKVGCCKLQGEWRGRGFPRAHFAMIWFRATERAVPTKIPAPRLTDADLKTIRSTSTRRAPSAIRIPNSLVRCATV